MTPHPPCSVSPQLKLGYVLQTRLCTVADQHSAKLGLLIIRFLMLKIYSTTTGGGEHHEFLNTGGKIREEEILLKRLPITLGLCAGGFRSRSLPNVSSLKIQ